MRRLAGAALLSVFVLGGLFLSGCSKQENPVSSGAPSSGTIVIPGVGVFPTFGVSDIRGFLGTIKEQQSSTISALALFLGPSLSQLVYAGDVSVNGNQLDTSRAFGNIFYANVQPLLNVSFNGTPHTWNVDGSGSVSRFAGSVTSPSGSVTLTSPSNNAIIPRGNSLTVTWIGSGTDSVLVLVSDARGKSLFAVATSGQHTFGITELATLSAGSGFVEVDRFRFSVHPGGGGNYILYSAVVDEVFVTLQ